MTSLKSRLAPGWTPQSSVAPPTNLRTGGQSFFGRSKKTTCLSEHYHPSRSEADYCNWLLARKQSGEIKGFVYQHAIPLIVNGKTVRVWQVDFLVEEKDGSHSYHESKGWNRSDDNFKLKRDMFLILYPERKLYVNRVLCTYKPSHGVKSYLKKIESRKKLRQNFGRFRPSSR